MKYEYFDEEQVPQQLVYSKKYMTDLAAGEIFELRNSISNSVIERISIILDNMN